MKKLSTKLKTAFILMVVALLNSCTQLPTADHLFNIMDAPKIRLSYNSQTAVLDNGKRRAEFHCKWINYMDEKLSWQEIDPNFVKTDRGFEMTKAPFEVVAPFYADGNAIFNNNDRYDVATNEIIYDKPLEQTIQALGTDHIAGRIETGDLGWGKAQYVVYPDAYPQYHADLIYWVHQGTEPRLRKFIRFNQALSQNTDFKFRVIYSDDVETVNTGKNVSVKMKFAKKRGSGWADFYVWDSKTGWAGRKPIHFDFEKPMLASAGAEVTNPNEYILTKHIEADYFKTATLPVFTDATTTFYPAAGTNTPVDGYVAYDAFTDWTTAHDASSGANSGGLGGPYPTVTSGDVARSYRYDNNSRKMIIRGFFLFDASSITSSATVSSATLSIYVSSKTDSYGDSYSWFNVVQTSPASTNNLSSNDYSQCGAITNPTYGASQITASNITTSAYNDFSLNTTGLTWISKTDITKLGLREGHDATNTQIGAGNNTEVSIQGYYADQSGTSQDPKLTLTYSVPTTPATVDWNNGNVQEITLAIGRIFTFNNGNNGGSYTLILKQDATGGWSVSWPSNVKWIGGTAPTLTTAANSTDMVKFVYDGTNYLAYTTALNIK